MLKVEGLTKTYPSFKLDSVSFHLPAGYIMGFIGANGAGKTTTLKSIMNIVYPDSGSVEIFGRDMKTAETENKQKIGFLLGAVNSYINTKVGKYLKITSTFYDDWQEEICEKYLEKFNIDRDKTIKELSQGMRVKLGLTVALSHGADLFILDEPTSGLDPVARDEILDILSDIVSNGDKSVLFSTHITSDLEKVADYILYIHNGIIVAQDTKDGILDSHILVHGDLSDAERIKKICVGIKINSLGFTALIKKENFRDGEGNFTTERPALDDIMVYYERGKND